MPDDDFGHVKVGQTLFLLGGRWAHADLPKLAIKDGLVQDCSNSSVLAMDLMMFCIKPSIEDSVIHMWISKVSQDVHQPSPLTM